MVLITLMLIVTIMFWSLFIDVVYFKASDMFERIDDYLVSNISGVDGNSTGSNRFGFEINKDGLIQIEDSQSELFLGLADDNKTLTVLHRESDEDGQKLQVSGLGKS